MAKIVPVIETRRCQGEGTKDNPFRTVMEYWSTGGTLLAENDPNICARLIKTEECQLRNANVEEKKE